MAKFRNSSPDDLTIGHPHPGLHDKDVAKDAVFDVPDELVLEEGHEHTSECTHPDGARVFPASLFTRVGGVPAKTDTPEPTAEPAPEPVAAPVAAE